MKIYYTTYDGFYIVVNNKKIMAYEGLALCPNKVKKWLENNEPIKLNYFYGDAICYGLCKEV